jgi:acetolactate synthase-1/2/3 large subunit
MRKTDFVGAVERGRTGRKGPVFLEFCLDAQGAPVTDLARNGAGAHARLTRSDARTGWERESLRNVDEVAGLLRSARRPIILLGGGVGRKTAADVAIDLRRIGAPVQTTWNGVDRIAADESIYAGRPNTWGQRFANILLQQADLVIALGTRLGLQQTGFNWQQFVPIGKVVHVDIDEAELRKGTHASTSPSPATLTSSYENLCAKSIPITRNGAPLRSRQGSLAAQRSRKRRARRLRQPVRFLLGALAIYVGGRRARAVQQRGANSTALQTLEQKRGQIIVTDKGLASMGYWLSGAIGAALACPNKRTIVVEGDGGFIQNAQELGTVAINDLNLKILSLLTKDTPRSGRRKELFWRRIRGLRHAHGSGIPGLGKTIRCVRHPGVRCRTRRLRFRGLCSTHVSARSARLYRSRRSRTNVFSEDREPRYRERQHGIEPVAPHDPELEPDVAEDVLRYLRVAAQVRS